MISLLSEMGTDMTLSVNSLILFDEKDQIIDFLWKRAKYKVMSDIKSSLIDLTIIAMSSF